MIKKVLILIATSILFLIGISLMPLGWLSKSNGTEQEIPSDLIVNEINQSSMTYWNSDLKLKIERTDNQFEWSQFSQSRKDDLKSCPSTQQAVQSLHHWFPLLLSPSKK